MVHDLLLSPRSRTRRLSQGKPTSGVPRSNGDTVLNLGILRAGLLAWWLAPAIAFAQSVPALPSDPVDAPTLPPPTPSQIARIQRSLDQPPGLKLDERQLRFYLEIVQRLPTFAEYSRGYDFLNGPTTGGNPMSHSEFVRLVTPKEMFSSAGFNANEQVQIALTNYVGQALIRKALEELKEARNSSEVQAIRERIERELDALTGVKRDKNQSDRSTGE